MQETWIRLLGQEDFLEEEMPTHSSILAWKIPRTKESGGPQSMRSQRVRHDLSTEYARTHTLLKGREHAVYLFASRMKFTAEKI